MARRRCGLLLGILAAAVLLLPLHTRAQLKRGASAANPLGAAGNNKPVAFTADQVEYDRDHALVIATGHVEAWQNGHVLYADRVTFDRNTNVAAASGNVVLLEPDGETLFANYAELSQGMTDGVLRGMSAILAQNGRLAANGARRTEGKINELSRVVYSTCNLCAKDPTRPPLWQIRALSAVQDTEHKQIEYTDATMEMWGIPVAYFPYFSHPDPSVKRASGLLIPSIGTTSHIGAFVSQPYYLVIDDQSDATFTPMLTTRAGPQIDVQYRRRFNDGFLNIDSSLGELEHQVQGTIFANGQFNYNDQWRYGFNINRASSSTYLTDFHIGEYGSDPNLLSSNVYLEGFGQGAYTRVETRFYQGLTSSITDSKLPVVLPRYQYSYFGQPDQWGGRLSVDAGAFNVERSDGTNTRRVNLSATWEKPMVGSLGDVWTVKLHNDAIGYDATDFSQQPNFGTPNTINDARALPQAALDWRWPFMRDSGSWGTQLIEPLAELVVAPAVGSGQDHKYPNEDSLDLEFTDANLFGFNRYPGIDRLDGGVRANVGLHTAWYLNGTTFDGLIGQSYRPAPDDAMPVDSGLHNTVSDVVARGTFTPSQYLDVTYRTRLDQHSLATKMADAVASFGVPQLRANVGYIYTTTNPYTLYDQPPPPPAPSSSAAFYFPRNEITLGANASYGHYRLNGYVRRDLATNQMVAVGADAIYEDECYIFDIRFNRRYTSYNGDNGSTSVLFQMTFKTIGQFGFRAL